MLLWFLMIYVGYLLLFDLCSCGPCLLCYLFIVKYVQTKNFYAIAPDLKPNFRAVKNLGANCKSGKSTGNFPFNTYFLRPKKLIIGLIRKPSEYLKTKDQNYKLIHKFNTRILSPQPHTQTPTCGTLKHQDNFVTH